jgi:hypothetical protein
LGEGSGASLYLTTCDGSPSTQTPEQQHQQCSRRPEVNRHLCRHTSAVHQATASRHTCHASRRRFTRHGHGRAYGAAYRSPGIGCKRFCHLFVCRTIRAWSRWAVVLKPSANLRRNDILKASLYLNADPVTAQQLLAKRTLHAYERHTYVIASVRSTPMRL